MVNEFFTYLKDIIRIFERMENILSDCCHPWTENPSNNSCSRQLAIVNTVVTLIASGVRSIDRSLFFSKLKLLILRQWWQLWMKSAMKQRYRMNLFFVVFCLIVLLPNSMSKGWFTIDVSLHVKLLIKKLYGCILVCKRTFGSLFFCASLLFSVVQHWNYTKTIICLRVGEYFRIIQSTSSRGLFDISKIQLVVYYQYCVLIGWATSRLFVIAH